MAKVIRIVLVDDEALQITYMQQLLKQAAERLSLVIQIDSYQSGEAFLFALEDHLDWDLAFLDIEMAQINGMEVAKRIRQLSPDLALVFATAYAEYAVEGYAVQALDYLLKPISLEKIEHVLQRFITLRPETPHYLIVDVEGQPIRLAFEEILYLEANKREVLVNTEQATYTVRQTLADFVALLDQRFVQTHRSYYVNLDAVTHLLKQDVQIKTGDLIPLSRRQAKEVQQAFIHYYRKSVFYEH